MRLLFVALLFLFNLVSLAAQFCSGNLGENIFEEGDFGSGTDNLIQVDPGIAPGYTYTTDVPPLDGFYTITNNTTAWNNPWQSWLNVPDNSNDPNGYMMVVNASFDPGLFYEQEVTGLCENTLYQFSADVLNMIRIGIADHIDPNISFLLDGVEQYTTGNIPKTETWNAYGFTFTTTPGQTSITLSLRNNAPGGIGNDLALDNISFRACGPVAQILPETVERICEDGNFTELVATIDGDQYPTPALQWQQSFDGGMNWVDLAGETNLTYTHTELASGFYYYRYLLANGPQNLSSLKCRVVSNIKIVEVVPKFWTVTDTICEGLTYLTGDAVYDQSGIYIDTLLSSIGCDSIVTLNLEVLNEPAIEADLNINPPPCIGDLGTLLIDTVRNGNPSYTYYLNDTLGGPAFNNLPAGDYQLRIVDRFGCTYDSTFAIREAAPFQVDLGPNQSVLLGESTRLNIIATDDIANYQWFPTPAGCTPDCPDPTVTPLNSQVYRLVATSDNGCLATDSVRIGVQKVRQVYLPNAFSPNFDGVNDVFLPEVNIPNVQTIMSMRVYNRWGGLVFEAENLPPGNPAAGWDGTFDGQPVAPGIYIYAIDVGFLDGAVINYSGDVLVIK